jgi:hypothetical protein
MKYTMAERSEHKLNRERVYYALAELTVYNSNIRYADLFHHEMLAVCQKDKSFISRQNKPPADRRYLLRTLSTITINH